MDGWIARWMDGQLVRWMDGQLARGMDGQLARGMDGMIYRSIGQITLRIYNMYIPNLCVIYHAHKVDPHVQYMYACAINVLYMCYTYHHLS